MSPSGFSVCPACGGALSAWLEVPSGEPADARRFALLRCETCASAVTTGDPPTTDLYETGTYAPSAPRAAALVNAFQRLTVGQPVRLLHRAGLAPGARVLDAGAGPGRLVAALAGAGFVATGIEPSKRSVAIAATTQRDVTRSSIEEHDDRDLDAVVLWHVLEHLEDPAGALTRIRGWLAPGGLLLVGVPNVRSLQAMVAGPGWLHYDVPRHRTHLSPEGLSRLLGCGGFALERVHHIVWEQNPHAMWMSLLTRLGMSPGFPFHLLKRTIRPNARDVLLLVAGLPLLPVALPLELAAGMARRGGPIAATARAVA